MSLKQLNNALFQAVDKGDLCGAIATLNLGAEVNAVHPELDDSPLHHAVENGHVQVAKVLLERGALVDGSLKARKPSSSESSAHIETRQPLIMAARCGHVELVNLLLEYNADVECKDEYGMTALMRAAENGHGQIVTALLDRKTESNDDDDEINAALMLASGKGYADVASILMEHNSTAYEIANRGMTALILAAKEGHSRAVSIFLESASSWSGNLLSHTVNKALKVAASRGHDDCVERILNYGAYLEFLDYHTPLLEAAKNDHLGAVKLLLYNRENVSNEQATAAMMVAATNGHAHVVSFLLSSPHGDNVAIDAKDIFSRTALYYAVTLEHDECVAILAEHGADLDERSENGWTALMLAAYHNCAKVVPILLERGAKVNLKDDKERTALIIAAEKGHYRVLKAIFASAIGDSVLVDERDTDSMTALMYAVVRGHKECINLLLERGADLDATDEDGRTALMIAICNFRLSALKNLINKGASITDRDKKGRTALMIAAENGDSQISETFVLMLLDRGADLKAVDDVGRTALFYAASAKNVISPILLELDDDSINATMYTTSAKLVRIFFDSGMDINHQDANSKTALMHAASQGNSHAVFALCQCGADVSIRDAEGYTAVLMTAVSGNTKCLSTILAHGGNISDTSKSQENVLHIAAGAFRSTFFGHLVSSCRLFRVLVNARNSRGQTPMMVAQQLGDWRIEFMFSRWAAREGRDDSIMGSVARAS